MLAVPEEVGRKVFNTLRRASSKLGARKYTQQRSLEMKGEKSSNAHFWIDGFFRHGMLRRATEAAEGEVSGRQSKALGIECRTNHVRRWRKRGVNLRRPNWRSLVELKRRPVDTTKKLWHRLGANATVVLERYVSAGLGVARTEHHEHSGRRTTTRLVGEALLGYPPSGWIRHTVCWTRTRFH